MGGVIATGLGLNACWDILNVFGETVMSAIGYVVEGGILV